MNRSTTQMESQVDKVKFGYYIVAIIDILGQNHLLRNLKELPSNDGERDQFIRSIKHTFGVVLGIRSWLKDFYDTFSDYSKERDSLLEDLKPVYDNLRRTELKFQQFSDTIVMYTSLDEQASTLPLNGVYATLLASGTAMICSLAAKNPVRGGIEIGIGGELFENEIYGSCLVNSHDLEKDVARYPRIVIGTQTIDYLKNKRDQRENSLIAKYEKILATSCLNLLVKDIDGYPIIDYLGEGFVKIMKTEKIDDDLLPKAYIFVEDQANKWQKEGNTKLAFRYNLLRQYFLSRISK